MRFALTTKKNSFVVATIIIEKLVRPAGKGRLRYLFFEALFCRRRSVMVSSNNERKAAGFRVDEPESLRCAQRTVGSTASLAAK